MPKKVWIKLHIELLDDPKMGRMPDWLWRRAVELFLLAGENGDDGLLQPVEDMAWRLRTSPEKLTESLQALSQVGVVHETPEGWTVTNFKKRQYSESYERVKKYREEQKRYKERESNDDGNESELSSSDSSSEDVSSGSGILGGDARGGGASSFLRYRAGASKSIADAESLLLKASGLSALPENLIGRLDMVCRMVQTCGEQQTLTALQDARSAWVGTRRKDNSGNYSVLNGAWVDWALAHLAGETPWKKSDGHHEQSWQSEAWREAVTVTESDPNKPIPTWDEFTAIPQETLDKVILDTCTSCGTVGDCIRVKDGPLCLEHYREWRIELLGLDKRYRALGGALE